MITITTKEVKKALIDDPKFIKRSMTDTLNDIMQGEMNQVLNARLRERTENRRGYRSGYYKRSLVIQGCDLNLKVPRDRGGEFKTNVFERYQRSQKAFVSAVVDIYENGVSTRKVGQLANELCGREFSASAISALTKRFEERVKAFYQRKLEPNYPYVILDARYEKVREGGTVKTHAVLIAIGINCDGKSEVLGIELAKQESTTSWREFLMKLRSRGLTGVKFVVSDNHQGLKTAIKKVFPEALWQRCYVHFLRNASTHLPKKADPNCMKELCLIYKKISIFEAKEALINWKKKWSKKYHKLCDWVENNIEETLVFYQLPQQHHRQMCSTNFIERLNQEIKRRTSLVRTFPNRESCLRLVRSVALTQHEKWMKKERSFDMSLLIKHEKEGQVDEMHIHLTSQSHNVLQLSASAA